MYIIFLYPFCVVAKQINRPGSRITWYVDPEPSPKEDSDIVDSDSDEMYENVKVGECSGHEICCMCKIVHYISSHSRSCSQCRLSVSFVFK